MSNLSELINDFVNYLNACYMSLEKLTHESKYDLLQSSWEIIVESRVSNDVYLEVYGEGADLNPKSSRICLPEKLPTHYVACLPKNGPSLYDELNNINVIVPKKGLPLDEFVTKTNKGWYEKKPPFDYVLVNYEGVERLFKSDSISYALSKSDDV